MTAVDGDNLASRMRRIRELTEMLLALQTGETEMEDARTLAEDVGQEISLARLQIRLYTPGTLTHDASISPNRSMQTRCGR